MSLRESPSGRLRGLARLLFGGGNDAGGFPITNLGAPESSNSAARLADVEGAYPARYTVGPAGSGATYTSFQAAVDQAVLDGAGTSFGGAVFFLYAGFYNESVTIPASLQYYQILGSGRRGTAVLSLAITMGTADSDITIDGINFLTFTTTQAVGGSPTNDITISECWFNSGFNVTGPDIRLWLNDCLSFSGTCTFSGVAMVTTNFTATGTVTSTATQALRGTEIIGGVINGVLNVAGASCAIQDVTLYADAVATVVNDSCTAASVILGNAFVGIGGSNPNAYSKTGTSTLFQTGNDFVNGYVFPYFNITAGSVVTGFSGQLDAAVVAITGSPTLTVAQIGGRHTTFNKTDAGGNVTLPSAALFSAGQKLTVKDFNGSATASPVTITPDGSDTIDGGASIQLATNRQALTLQRSHVTTAWEVASSYPGV